MEEVTADAVEMAKELQLGVQPEDATEPLQFHDKTFMQQHRRQFLGTETTPGEDAVEAVEATTKDLECYTNLIDKVASSLQGIDSDLKEAALQVKCYETALLAVEKPFVKRRVNCCGELRCCLLKDGHKKKKIKNKKK